MRTIRALCLGAVVAVACLVGVAQASAAPFVYITDASGGTVQEYDAASGPLKPLQSAGVAGANPKAVAVTPDGTSVYVVNTGDGSSPGTVSQYDVQADGSLAPKSQRTVPASSQPSAIAVNPDGKAVYVTNFGDGTVSQYDIGPGGVLSATIPPIVKVGKLGCCTNGLAVSPDGKSVYVSSGAVYQFNVGAGDTLTAKKPAFAADSHGPGDVAVSPDGKSAYVVNGDNSVSEYNIAADGTLHARTSAPVATGTFPIGIAVSPDSQSVYVADHSDGQIAEYAATPKGLVLKTPETISAGGGPLNVVVSPDGQHVYATDDLTPPSGALLEYSGGNGPGTLTPLSPPVPFFTSPGALPVGIAIGPTRIRFSCGGVIESCAVGSLLIGSGGSTTAVAFTTKLVRAAPLGILIQRIVGKRRVLVGHVPFGLRPTGRVHIRWNLRVNRHRLSKGRYLITLRMFDREQHLIALAHPVQITVT
jgi:DNA-binding beta-propeller fold protein YncE